MAPGLRVPPPTVENPNAGVRHPRSTSSGPSTLSLGTLLWAPNIPAILQTSLVLLPAPGTLHVFFPVRRTPFSPFGDSLDRLHHALIQAPETTFAMQIARVHVHVCVCARARVPTHMQDQPAGGRPSRGQETPDPKTEHTGNILGGPLPLPIMGKKPTARTCTPISQTRCDRQTPTLTLTAPDELWGPAPLPASTAAWFPHRKSEFGAKN